MLAMVSGLGAKKDARLDRDSQKIASEAKSMTGATPLGLKTALRLDPGHLPAKWCVNVGPADRPVQEAAIYMDDDGELKLIKKGDQIEANYVEAVAVSFEPVKK